MPSVSAAQFAALGRAGQSAAGQQPSYKQDDSHTLGLGSNGGWEGDVSPDAHSAINLSSAQRPFAFRAPERTGLGVNTIGTWQGMGPSWHERYKTEP